MHDPPQAVFDFSGHVLRVPAAVVSAMIDHARRQLPNECCGLLSGVDRKVRSIHPLVNEADDPQTGFLATAGLIAPFKQMRQAGEELLAIYHSHPSSPAVPSRKDLARNYYPDVVHVIISLAGPAADVRAFLLEADDLRPVEIATESG